MNRWVELFATLIVLVALATTYFVVVQIWRVKEVRGTVIGGTGPLHGAVVRLKATGFETKSDENGRFIINGFPPGFSVPVTAWVEGYYIGGATALPWKRTVEITVEPHLNSDNHTYTWVPPAILDRSVTRDYLVRAGLAATARLSFNRLFLPLSAKLKLGCADCHGEIIYKQWAGSAHALGTSNMRFRTLYNGTDIKGNQSPPTRYMFQRDYGRIPVLPDASQPYFGPGFKLDSPDAAGNCATCHVPSAALSSPYGIDPNTVSGVEAQGSHCDFCHKVAEVKLDPANGLPYENMPGVLSLVLRRPSPERQLFFGPYDDVDVGPDTFSPLQRKSEYCAPCHNASFWGTPIYQSFAEWKASPYSDPVSGKTCQDCHMKPDGIASNFAPGRGGLERDPVQIFTHAFPGVDTKLLQNTATLRVDARQDGDKIHVEIGVTNSEAGHHIPTDHPMRNIILLIEATDAKGHKLALVDGPTVPEWGGKGPDPDDYAGRPGKGYAKVLENLWTEDSPSVAYWRQTVILEDTRIPALATDISTYAFAAPMEAGPVKVTASLVFRRAFKQLAEVKGWEMKDIVMATKTTKLDMGPK